MDQSEGTVEAIQEATIKKMRIMIPVSRSTTKHYPCVSLSSSHAFNWILEKLIPPKCSEDYELFILHVQVPDGDGLDGTDSMFATADDFRSVKEEEKSRGMQLLEDFVNRSHMAKISCKAWIKKGDPREVICMEVKRIHPDVLVLGSRGLSTLRRMFVGSVSEYCIKHVPCPVLLIKRSTEDAPEDKSDD